ncbi:MAG TPA: META domain-containing protein [Chitinophagaceae bacterium]|nr:META domain-containing protein [Chitinophagaceae bacterium]
MKASFLATFLLMSILMAYAVKKNSSTPALSGEYELTHYLAGSNWQTFSGTNSSINFDKKQKSMTLFVGCNRATGKFSQQKKQLHVGPLMSTKMFCEGIPEQEIFTIMESVTNFSVNANTITLYNGNKKIAALKKKEQRQEIKIADGVFQIESYRKNGAMVKMPAPTSTNITIEKERFYCNVGCNSMGADWFATDFNVRTLQIATTEMGCPGEIGKIEADIAALLSQLNRFTISASQLCFYNNDTLLMVMKRKS